MLLSLLLISCAPSIRYVRGTEEGVDVALNGAWKGREFSLVSPRYGRLDQAHTTGRHLYFDLPIDIDSSTLDSRLYVQDHDYTLGLRGHRGDYIFENNAWIATIRCKRALKDIRTHPDPAAVKAACADASSLRSAQAAGDQLLRAELELRAVQQRVQEAKTALSRTVRHLTAAEARLWENDQWLRQESAVWVGGSCVAPPAAPPPKMPLQACQPSEAGSFGLAVCGAIYMASNGVPFTKFDGCGELGELARQKSNEGWAKMVDAADSTVCEAALNYYFGRSTSDDEVLQDLAEGMATEGLDLLADSLLEEGGFWNSFAGGALKLGLGIKTGVDYLECAEDIEESCVASYEAWQAERQDVQSRPERLQAECKERSQERPKLTKSIEEYKTEIRRLTRLIQEEEGALEDATRQVAAAEGSLSLALSRWHSTADRALSGQSTGGGGPVISVDLPDLRGSAFTRQEWPWLGVGAGAGAFWLPTGYLQNTATAFEAVPTFNLSAFLTVAPIRLGGELRTGGGKREVHGYQTLSEGELVAVDRLRLEHEQLGVWLDWLPLSGHLAWFSPSLGGGAIVTRDNLTAEIAGIDRDHPYNTPGWTLRGGLSFSPWNHYVQLRAQGEAVYFRGYGWAPSLGISLDYTPLSRRR